MAFANKLELHYYFNDDSHSMDAFVRNKCEAELLALINEVKTQLGFDFHIDAEALNEGTLRERWKFVGENAPQIGIILSIIAIIISVSQLYESKQDEMDEELKRLSIEEKKLFIEKLKKELYEGQASNDSIKDTALSINNDLKVLTRKSNFYKALDNYEKVVAVSFNPLTIENKPIYPEKQILKSEFYKYILSTNEIPEEVIQKLIGVRVKLIFFSCFKPANRPAPFLRTLSPVCQSLDLLFKSFMTQSHSCVCGFSNLFKQMTLYMAFK